MQDWICLLRGINVGGRNKLPMAQLRTLLQQNGYTAKTFIQSGNIVLKSQQNSRAQLQEDLEKLLLDNFDLRVPIVLRTLSEWNSVLASSPFSEIDDDKHLVVFLSEAPSLELEEVPAGEDSFQLSGQEIYLHCPNGYGRTKLTHALWERRLKVTATVRNWKTVKKLATLAQGDKSAR